MKNISRYWLVLFVTIWMVWSCKPGQKRIKEEARIMALRIEYDSLLAASDSSWNKMIAEDDDKMFYMKRLLQEISFSNTYNAEEHDKLLGKIDAMKRARYSRKSMKNGNLIDSYDSVTIETISMVIRFARSHPEFENSPLWSELIAEINKKDERVLFDRVDYDACAGAYNQFIMEHASEMDKIEPEGGFGKMALFAIGAGEEV